MTTDEKVEKLAKAMLAIVDILDGKGGMDQPVVTDAFKQMELATLRAQINEVVRAS